MIAPDPDMLPAAISESKSYGRSSISTSFSASLPSGPLRLSLNRSPALNTFAEEPPGITAFSFLPSRNPPPKAGSPINWPIVTLPTSIS